MFKQFFIVIILVLCNVIITLENNERGIYFSKNKYQGGNIPAFSKSISQLPVPVISLTWKNKIEYSGKIIKLIFQNRMKIVKYSILIY